MAHPVHDWADPENSDIHQNPVDPADRNQGVDHPVLDVLSMLNREHNLQISFQCYHGQAGDGSSQSNKCDIVTVDDRANEEPHAPFQVDFSDLRRVVNGCEEAGKQVECELVDDQLVDRLSAQFLGEEGAHHDSVRPSSDNPNDDDDNLKYYLDVVLGRR